METNLTAGVSTEKSGARFKTTFASQDQVASLVHTLDLTAKEIDQVSGGLARELVAVPDCIVPDCIVFPPPDCIIVQNPDCILAATM
jgi:hypothetical protein